ncbi:universal stress protein, partial [Eudoraea sp.]|uniref:universal stress protein n=1 Tax=Eudoraea sp. TaxID=1979955 RepID=UPI003C77EC64
AAGARGLTRTLFGSTDMKLMRKCPCPVWIVKGTERHQYRRILAAVDQDPEGAVKDGLNRQILEMSTSLALAEFSELHIVHAWRLFGESHLRSPHTAASDAAVDEMASTEAGRRTRWLEKLVNNYGTPADKDAVDYIGPKLHVVEGDAEHTVPTTAVELDAYLIVMGTVARTGVAGFIMGNTAETILNQIDCSVLTVKPPGFVSPVAVQG